MVSTFLVVMAILAYPMTYLAHRGLARFVLSSKIKNADFTDVVEEHFGAKAGRSISLLYFLSIFPILLIYGVGITNTVDSFMVNQAGNGATATCPTIWRISIQFDCYHDGG